MAYQPLSLHPTTPQNTRAFIGHALEGLYFRDLHTILRLPITEEQLMAGCNFAGLHVLLAAVGGISTVLYKQATSKTGHTFRKVLVEYYPWDHEEPEPKDDDIRERIANALYKEFRGPLTHNLGVWMKPIAKGQFVAGKRGYYLKIIRLEHDRNGLPEAQIEILERSSHWPFTAMRKTLEFGDQGTVINLERFYWGVRRMVERLTEQPALMERVEKFLTSAKA